MQSSPAEIAQLRPTLESLLGKIVAIAPLPSGAGGQSYRVTTASAEYAAKVFLPDAPVLLGAEAQFALFGELAQSGIAPRPVAVDAGLALLVTEFVADTRSVTAESLGDHECIEALADVLRRLHAVAFAVPPFAPLAYAERYLTRLGGRSAIRHTDHVHLDELMALAARPLPGPPCLCHNDLTIHNLLFGQTLQLIDFDYAAIATPILDLASVVCMNDLPTAAVGRLLEAYYAGPPPYSVKEFARVQRLHRLLAHFWSLAAGAGAAPIVAGYQIRDD
jgi:aminoglycoside phosphotransferase (APT) family kinase protein